MKKNIIAALIATAFIVPTAVSAEGNIIGTDGYALASGLPNVYYQGKLSDSTAWTVNFATVTILGVNLNQFGGSYKGYLGDYANAPFWSVGAALVSGGGASGVAATANFGYEATLGGSFVVAPYFGIAAGSGGTASGIGFNLGFKM